MTGRIEEQAYLKAAIADPLQAGVLVAGGAGVGKTCLLREATEGQTDNRIEFVTATESARPLPFGAFAHLLPEDLGAVDRVDLLAVIGRHLVHRAEGKPLVLAVDAQAGLTSSAIDQLWAAAELAAARGQRSFEIFILHDLLRLGEHRAAERARRVAERVDGAWSTAIAAHAAAILTSDTVALETAAEAFVVIGSSLVAAELWASASTARQAEGLQARANAAARRSLALAELCEGARTPALSGTVTLTPLTRRERETATLAARGATNAQIADTLSISERTVESHLSSTFAKLGINGRNQLADALGD